MTNVSSATWSARRVMPELTTLDDPTRRKVRLAVDRLREVQNSFGHRFLAIARERIPDYQVLTDAEIRDNAQKFMDTLVAELTAMRVPDAALRDLLIAYATDRMARGISPEVLALGYQLGSRAMLAQFDEVGAHVGLPAELMLAVHDSTWEFANEASGVFLRIQRDLAIEKAHFDAERRSVFAGEVLGGTLPAQQILHDAHLFGLDPRARHVPLAARAASPGDAEAVRQAIASALRLPAGHILVADMGAGLGFIAPKLPERLTGHLVAAGPAAPLDQLHAGYTEAVLALDTAQRFGQSGLVRLAGLGPRPLVLSVPAVADGLSVRHLHALDSAGRANVDIEETTRVYLECDQDVREVAQRLSIHQNTVRYRVQRFTELTELDLRRTEDLVTAWWLLNRRR
ncbi:PucR family transcriptional regulator [Actinoplanes sp. NPDC000266]